MPTTRLTPAAERRIRRTATGFVIFVALAAAVLSFTGLYELALQAGFHPWIAPLFPLATDVAVAAFSLAVLHHSLTGMRVWYPWMCMLLGVAVSVAGNVWAAPHDDVARLVHAWPPIVFALAFEALTRLIRHRVHVTQAETTETADANAVVHEVPVVALVQPPTPQLAPAASAAGPLRPRHASAALSASPGPSVTTAPPATPATEPVQPRPDTPAPDETAGPSAPREPVAASSSVRPATVRPGSVRERVAALLSQDPTLSAGEIARRIDADPSNVSKIVKKLRADSQANPNIPEVAHA